MYYYRFLSLADPNVDVVYVSPRRIDSEVLDYYHKLLAMGSHGEQEEGGAVGGDKGAEFRRRIHIVTPEYAGAFAHHNLSLSTELLYSPKALQRIKHLVAGREAYIVPGVVGRDDIAVADALGEVSNKSLSLSSLREYTSCFDDYCYYNSLLNFFIICRSTPAGLRTRAYATLLHQIGGQENFHGCRCSDAPECGGHLQPGAACGEAGFTSGRPAPHTAMDLQASKSYQGQGIW